MTKQDRNFLRKKGHEIHHPFLFGKGEVDDGFLLSIDNALKAKELIKVKCLNTASLPIAEVSRILCEKLGCEEIFTVGHMALLYRQSEKRLYLK